MFAFRGSENPVTRKLIATALAVGLAMTAAGCNVDPIANKPKSVYVVGDSIVAGPAYGRVRAMLDELGGDLIRLRTYEAELFGFIDELTARREQSQRRRAATTDEAAETDEASAIETVPTATDEPVDDVTTAS